MSLMSSSPTLGIARLAVAAGFFTQGFVFISLTTRLPAFSDRWQLSELGLSGVLLMMVLLSGAGSVVAEKSAAGPASLLRIGLALTVVAVPMITAAPHVAFFVAGLAVYGVALGMVDATTNTQAVALEHRYHRPILPSFHGAWTLGGLLGAIITLSTADLPLPWNAGLAAVPLVVAFAPFLALGSRTAPAVAVPWRPIMLVGAALVLFYMVDTAAFTWGPTYLDQVFDTPSRLVALATLPYLAASGIVRLLGDGLVRRYGAVVVLRGGALVASLGLAVVVFAPVWPVAILGFTIVGAGAATIAPLSFSAAARIAGIGEHGVDAVIARFNQFNYLGALLGAVMTGVVGSGSLRIGFAVPLVLILGLLPLARAFARSATGVPVAIRSPGEDGGHGDLT